MVSSYLRLSSIGGNGLKMLLLTLLLTAGTAGLSLFAAQFHVWRVARRHPVSPSPCRQLLVLGMQLNGGECREEYRQRLERGRRLLEEGVGQTLYLLGGITAASAPSEAAAGRDYLLRQGCDAGRVVIEERSRHTLENLQQVRALLGEECDCAIITSRTHLARTAAMAKGMGLAHQLCAAEASLRLTPQTLTRLFAEGFMLQWYYTGRYWARLVGDRDSLKRIS
jgi:uncharacterized SAM-binding protein YcdF (DUF218 family)